MPSDSGHQYCSIIILNIVFSLTVLPQLWYYRFIPNNNLSIALLLLKIIISIDTLCLVVENSPSLIHSLYKPYQAYLLHFFFINVNVLGLWQ